jgi:hypothetical protein
MDMSSGTSTLEALPDVADGKDILAEGVLKAIIVDSALIYDPLSRFRLRIEEASEALVNSPEIHGEDEISHSLVPLTFLGRITPLTFREPDS